MALINPRIVYSPNYDIHYYGLEKLHPFDGRKYSRAWNLLKERFGEELTRRSIPPALRLRDHDLLAVHTPTYLKVLQSKAYLAEALEVAAIRLLPKRIIQSRVIDPMRLATSGTIIAARLALKHGLAVNMSGGYHHASRDRGEGYSIYADVSIAIEKLRRVRKLKPGDTALIIDLDAHQGNGHERVAKRCDYVTIFDMYNADEYPQDTYAQRRIDFDVQASNGWDDDRYLSTLEDRLTQALARMQKPKIAFYIAGTDIYEHDTLGGLKVSEAGILRRDQFVFDTLMNAGIPTVMVLGGGYSKDSYRLVANGVGYILETWGRD